MGYDAGIIMMTASHGSNGSLHGPLSRLWSKELPQVDTHMAIRRTGSYTNSGSYQLAAIGWVPLKKWALRHCGVDASTREQHSVLNANLMSSRPVQ